jgi:hypothetical protein
MGGKYLNGYLRSGEGYMEWIDLAQERDKWRAVVSVIIAFMFNKMLGIS